MVGKNSVEQIAYYKIPALLSLNQNFGQINKLYIYENNQI